eukprot:scaffold2224_cov261-Pinguiococcus_pyrenoidosus.AAC.28
MLKGVETLADAVQVTLGPKGRNAVIEQSFGKPKITKDGVTVAKSIEFKDRFMNLGAQLVRDVANRTNDVAGDGTTTATVLTRAIFAESVKALGAGMNPIDVQRGSRMAVDKVHEVLEEISRTISTPEEISQVGTISANGEAEIGNLISSAMEKVGIEGVITVQDGKTMNNELETVEGMKFERGYISPYFITDSKKQVVEFENPYILLVEKKISSMQSLIPVLEKTVQTGRPLLIIAEDVESDALATLVVNKLRANLKVCAVKSPGFGDNRKATMQDMAVLTGATVISEETGHKLENTTEAQLGSCKTVTITKDDTILLDGSGSREAIEERCDLLRESLKRTTSDFEHEKLSERLAKMSGGVAVIKVGGASDVEVQEKKDRVIDALNATRAAVQEGIVPGGGTALLWASKALEQMEKDAPDLDTRTGIEIVKNALRAPVRTIAANAGLEGAVIVGEVLKFDKPEMGFNARTEQYVDMYADGIIDPKKVVRTALSDAQSIASIMGTAESFICDLPVEEQPPAGPPAGMGGMPGMM